MRWEDGMSVVWVLLVLESAHCGIRGVKRLDFDLCTSSSPYPCLTPPPLLRKQLYVREINKTKLWYFTSNSKQMYWTKILGRSGDWPVVAVTVAANLLGMVIVVVVIFCGANLLCHIYICKGYLFIYFKCNHILVVLSLTM